MVKYFLKQTQFL